jgi:hypothetical protein
MPPAPQPWGTHGSRTTTQAPPSGSLLLASARPAQAAGDGCDDRQARPRPAARTVPSGIGTADPVERPQKDGQGESGPSSATRTTTTPALWVTSIRT